eukprot:g1160.t1
MEASVTSKALMKSFSRVWDDDDDDDEDGGAVKARRPTLLLSQGNRRAYMEALEEVAREEDEASDYSDGHDDLALDADDAPGLGIREAVDGPAHAMETDTRTEQEKRDKPQTAEAVAVPDHKYIHRSLRFGLPHEKPKARRRRPRVGAHQPVQKKSDEEDIFLTDRQRGALDRKAAVRASDLDKGRYPLAVRFAGSKGKREAALKDLTKDPTMSETQPHQWGYGGAYSRRVLADAPGVPVQYGKNPDQAVLDGIGKPPVKKWLLKKKITTTEVNVLHLDDDEGGRDTTRSAAAPGNASKLSGIGEENGDETEYNEEAGAVFPPPPPKEPIPMPLDAARRFVSEAHNEFTFYRDFAGLLITQGIRVPKPFFLVGCERHPVAVPLPVLNQWVLPCEERMRDRAEKLRLKRLEEEMKKTTTPTSRSVAARLDAIRNYHVQGEQFFLDDLAEGGDGDIDQSPNRSGTFDPVMDPLGLVGKVIEADGVWERAQVLRYDPERHEYKLKFKDGKYWVDLDPAHDGDDSVPP